MQKRPASATELVIQVGGSALVGLAGGYWLCDRYLTDEVGPCLLTGVVLALVLAPLGYRFGSSIFRSPNWGTGPEDRW